MTDPSVTVLMSVYNGERHLREAIDSILGQTFSSFEFLVIDDGSTDGSAQILSHYAGKDPRLRVVKNDGNIGLTRSLNKGLAMARGDFVARMDADDISMPSRLEKQVGFLRGNGAIAVLGTQIMIVNDEGAESPMPEPYPTAPGQIRWNIVFENCLGHPTVMFRKDAVVALGGYNEAYRYAQDYDLWLRASQHFEMANLGEVLVKFRVSSDSITSTRLEKQTSLACEAMQQHLKRTWDMEIDADLALYLRRPYLASDAETAMRLARIICSLYRQWTLRVNASAKEKPAVATDAALRLLVLASRARTAPWVVMRICGLALRTSPRYALGAACQILLPRLTGRRTTSLRSGGPSFLVEGTENTPRC